MGVAQAGKNRSRDRDEGECWTVAGTDRDFVPRRIRLRSVRGPKKAANETKP